MNREKIEATARRLIDEGQKGFTITPDGDEYRGTEGYAVAERTFITLGGAMSHLKEEQRLGYWVDPADGTAYFETVDIYGSRPMAVLAGRMRGQRYIYGFAEDEPIDLEQG